MATTAINSTDSKPITYTMLVIFTVNPESHENLQDQQAIRDEATSWLESLAARVEGICVRKAG